MLDTTRVERELGLVRAHAAKLGLDDNLDDKLRFLDNYAGRDRTRCTLYPDHAPYSFTFTMDALGQDGVWHRRFDGGLLYHGPEDGYGCGCFPTLAVTLDPTHGWTIHT